MPQAYDTTLDHYRATRMGNGLARENKHQRFLRLAKSRVQRAIDAIEMVGRLSSSANEYSEHEAHRIVLALSEEVAEVERRLMHVKPQKKMFSFEE